MRKKILIISLMCVAFGLVGCTDTNEVKNANNMDGYATYVKDFVDAETGVHYLIYDDGTSAGMTVRYNSKGEIMTDHYDY